MVPQGPSGTKYRSELHLRLVSNAPPTPKPDDSQYDDEFQGDQTILVRLGDVVKATVLLGDKQLAQIDLPVGLSRKIQAQEAHDTPHIYKNTILTARVNFITLEGVNSAPETIVARLSEDWAQAGVRFVLARRPATVPLVENVFDVFCPKAAWQAPVADEFTIRATSKGRTADIGCQIDVGDSITDVSAKLVKAFRNAGFGDQRTTGWYRCYAHYVTVMVKKGEDVQFAFLDRDAGGFQLRRAGLNLRGGAWGLKELEALALNVRDEDKETIDIVALPEVQLIVSARDGAWAVGYGEHTIASPALVNISFLTERCVDFDDATHPTTAGHEMGHVLGDTSKEDGLQHTPDATNLMYSNKSAPNGPEKYHSSKRLTLDQHLVVRRLSCLGDVRLLNAVGHSR
jgi:hypothetical protein